MKQQNKLKIIHLLMIQVILVMMKYETCKGSLPKKLKETIRPELELIGHLTNEDTWLTMKEKLNDKSLKTSQKLKL